MKKKFIFLILFICIAGIGIYFYAYKGHRDIATETADFTVKIADLQKEFAENDSLAYKKYQDKTIETSGKISNIELESKGIVIDEKIFATFKETLPKDISIGQQVKIKGRFLGYDDLLEEFKIDQITIIE
jgi:hypothetical protein